MERPKKRVLVFDIATRHASMTMQEFVKCYFELGIVFYTSVNPIGQPEGNKPYFDEPTANDHTIIIDVATEEGKYLLEKLQERNKN